MNVFVMFFKVVEVKMVHVSPSQLIVISCIETLKNLTWQILFSLPQCPFTSSFSQRFGTLVPYLWNAQKKFMSHKKEKLTLP